MRAFFTLILTLLLAGAAAAQVDEVTATAYQTINVRSGPGTQFDIVARLSEGDTVPVDGRDSPESLWLRVVLENDARGWVAYFTVMVTGDVDTLPIPQENTTGTPAAADGDVRVLAYGRVNVRSGPAITYEVVSELEAGDEALAVARSNEASDWLLIERGGDRGWVAYFTVTVLGDTTLLPVRVPELNGDGLIPPSALVPALFNARLRGIPAFAGPVLGIVPFGAEVQPLRRSLDSRWLYVAYDGRQGWSLAQLFDITAEAISALPTGSAAERATPQPPVSGNS